MVTHVSMSQKFHIKKLTPRVYVLLELLDTHEIPLLHHFKSPQHIGGCHNIQIQKTSVAGYNLWISEEEKTEVTWVQKWCCSYDFRWWRGCTSSSRCRRRNNVLRISDPTGWWVQWDTHLQNQPDAEYLGLFSRSICQLPFLSRLVWNETGNLLPPAPHNCQPSVLCISEN